MARKGSKAKRNGRIAWVLGIALVLVLVGGGWYMFSAGGDAGSSEKVDPSEEVPVEVDGVKYPTGVNSELFGKASTLTFAAFDRESASESQVATTAYMWVSKWDTDNGEYGPYTYAGTLSLSATARTSSTTAVVGDKVRLIGFDSTYVYGDELEFIVKQSADLKNLNVYNASASSTVTYYDENGDAVTNTTAGVTVGTTNYEFDKIRLKNTDDYTTIRPAVVGFDYAESTNISEIRLAGAEKYTLKIERLNLDDQFIWTPGDINNADTDKDTPKVTVVPDGDNVASETLTTYFIDSAPFLTKSQDLGYGVQDDATNPGDVGLSDISQAITLV